MDTGNVIPFKNPNKQKNIDALKEYLIFLISKIEEGEEVKLFLFSDQDSLAYGYSDSDLLAILEILKAFILKDVLDG